MSIFIHHSDHKSLTTVELGDFSVSFSSHTLIAFAMPGLGSVKSANPYGATTARHLAEIPAKYENVPVRKFAELELLLNDHLAGRMTRRKFIARAEKILGVESE